MAFLHDKDTTLAAPTFYTVIRLARLVQTVRDRLKSLVNQPDLFNDSKPSLRRRPSLNHDTNVHSRSHSLRSCDCRVPSTLRHWKKGSQYGELGCAGLLLDLDATTAIGSISLCKNAARDSLLLHHNFNHISSSKDLVSLRRVSTLTNTLLKRMKCLRRNLYDHVIDPLALEISIEELVYDRFLANLEHLLRSLQHVALAAIVCLCFTWFLASCLQSRQTRKDVDGWFTEWPNGQHPLSTTWPWNVRPSLLVLWGVCWMFYYGDGPPSSGAAEDPYSAGAYGQDFRTRQPTQDSQPRLRKSHLTPHSPPGLYFWPPETDTHAPPDVEATDTLSSPVAPQNYSWLHLGQASQRARRANDRESYAGTRGHLTSSLTGLAELLGPGPQSGYLATSDAPNVSYISPSPYGHADVLPPTPVTWTYPQPSNLPLAPSNTPPSRIWQQPLAHEFAFPAAPPPQRLGSSHVLPDDTPRKPRPQEQLPTPITQSTGHAVGGSGIEWPLGLQTAMHNYPLGNYQNYPSPHSDVSGPTNTSGLSVHAGLPMSPSKIVAPSPSIAETSDSRSSGRKPLEPTRNREGLLYCDFAECQANPPTFARLCEWTKHIEKHTRPYVCNEPGCETIRGFTYSGGLHRHQREVHQQHGGPKASCLCPYKDCKRSTGKGFSRRENLLEHLRRVHRNVPSVAGESRQDLSVEFPRPTKRKRRSAESEVREENDSDEDQQGSQQDLKQEVKKLRRELKEKDDRLRRLESQMERFARNQQQPRM